MASNGELQNENHRWPKRTKRLILHLQKKNILAIPQILGKTFCELMWQMLFAKFASRYMWLENSRVFH